MTKDYGRRAVLRAMAGAAVLLATARALRAQQPPPVVGGPSEPLWNFDSVTGPEHWSELSPDYALCQFGMEQSPVDLVDALKVSGSEALKIDYRPLTAHVVRAGWTLEIAFEPGCEIAINNLVFPLQKVVLRHPSEHLLSGRALEMELQLVHKAGNGTLAHLAVFVRQGRKNDALETMLTNLPDEKSEQGGVFALNPADLLPPPPEEGKPRAFYRYMGSTTVPPCTEGVVWTIFKTPVEASARQIRQIASIFPANARPANTVNRRFLLEYSG